jgi:hypothetical protein
LQIHAGSAAQHLTGPHTCTTDCTVDATELATLQKAEDKEAVILYMVCAATAGQLHLAIDARELATLPTAKDDKSSKLFEAVLSWSSNSSLDAKYLSAD